MQSRHSRTPHPFVERLKIRSARLNFERQFPQTKNGSLVKPSWSNINRSGESINPLFVSPRTDISVCDRTPDEGLGPRPWWQVVRLPAAWRFCWYQYRTHTKERCRAEKAREKARGKLSSFTHAAQVSSSNLSQTTPPLKTRQGALGCRSHRRHAPPRLRIYAPAPPAAPTLGGTGAPRPRAPPLP